MTLIRVKYYYNDKTKDDERGEPCDTHGRKQNSFRFLVRNLKGNRILERSRSGWENNFKINFTERLRNGVDCMIWVKTGTTGGLL
jgi:hypothetical protein